MSRPGRAKGNWKETSANKVSRCYLSTLLHDEKKKGDFAGCSSNFLLCSEARFSVDSDVTGLEILCGPRPDEI